MDILLIIAGLLLLFFGGEALLKGSVSLARNFGLSKLLVSMVVVGFGTSMPEMTVSIGAALKDSSDIATGNVVGSNIANILLIVGVASLIAVIQLPSQTIRRDIIMMMGASIMLLLLSYFGTLTAVMGVAMFSILIAYIVYAYIQEKKHPQVEHIDHIEQDLEPEKTYSNLSASVYTLIGMAGLVGGAYLLVDGATSIARGFGISEAVIGLTVVAIGTSLPELATAVIASIRKHGDVIIGNILGSNVFNILAILGITSIIQPIPIAPQLLAFDLWFMVIVSLLLGITLWFGIKMGRSTGIIMLLAYIGYTAYLYVGT